MGFFDNFSVAQNQTDFSITITDKDWKEEWTSLVSTHTTRVECDFVNRKVIIFLRQLKKGIVQDVIFHVLSSDKRKGRIDCVRIRPAKKKGKDAYEYIFKDGRVVGHQVVFSYAEKKDLVHRLDLEFDELELISPAKDFRPSTIIKKNPSDDIFGNS
jgi:hypothetical protein